MQSQITLLMTRYLQSNMLKWIFDSIDVLCSLFYHFYNLILGDISMHAKNVGNL